MSSKTSNRFGKIFILKTYENGEQQDNINWKPIINTLNHFLTFLFFKLEFNLLLKLQTNRRRPKIHYTRHKKMEIKNTLP
jgi:hypothetical protein